MINNNNLYQQISLLVRHIQCKWMGYNIEGSRVSPQNTELD